MNLIERKLRDPQHDVRYAAFMLEVQILLALEDKGWTFARLAKAVGTSKGNISRDLNGGLSKASYSRICKIVHALGLKLIPLCIPKEHEDFVLPKIRDMIQEPSSYIRKQISMKASPYLPYNEFS